MSVCLRVRPQRLFQSLYRTNLSGFLGARVLPQAMAACCSNQSGSGDLHQQRCHDDNHDKVHESVKQYFSKEMKTKDDCLTGINCLVDNKMAPHIRQAMEQVHEEVAMKYYGCGTVIPEAVEGCSVLDLGSGSGRDCYALSRLVGDTGRVVGIDMTEEQLAVARQHVDYHTKKFGYSKPNVDFVFGYIEKLAEAGLKENTFDIVVSNCVMNLSPDKPTVIKEAQRVLKEGGELYFSDIYTDTYLPDGVKQNYVLWGECLAGALHWEDLHKEVQQMGFSQPRLVRAKMVDVSKFTDFLGKARFVSVTYRLFKMVTTTRGACHVTYTGGILGSPEKLKFDHAVTFMKDAPLAVDAELATILSLSRFSNFFTFDDSGPVTPVTQSPKVDPFLQAEDQGSPLTAGCCG